MPVCVPSSTRSRGAVAHTIQCAKGTCSHHALGDPSLSARQNRGSRQGSERTSSVRVQSKAVIPRAMCPLVDDCCGCGATMICLVSSFANSATHRHL